MQSKWFLVLITFALILTVIVPVTAQDSTPTATEMITPCPAGGAPDAAPNEGALKVLTTFTILADMARNVGCGLLNVQSITKPGTEIHGYEPTPSDLVKTQNTNLVLFNGLGLERWFEKFMGSIKDVPTVNLSDGIDLIPIAEGEYLDKPNPHAWMSPKNALIYIENIRKAFIALDPANAAAYTENATAYSQQVEQVSVFLQSNLDQVPPEQRYLVSCEGAFSYIIRDYAMQELYMWPINADQTGTPKQVAKVINGVRKNSVPVVFCESTVNQRPMEEVANQTGARYGGYLYVDSLTEADGEAPTYIKLLEYDATTIVNGLLGKGE
jgi:manganese transport system substrate-binding protein